MRLSRIGQHIKDPPCAQQRALLSVTSSRSQAFLEISDLLPQFFFSPLVQIAGRKTCDWFEKLEIDGGTFPPVPPDIRYFSSLFFGV
jgi:hypothetical protein